MADVQPFPMRESAKARDQNTVRIADGNHERTAVRSPRLVLDVRFQTFVDERAFGTLIVIGNTPFQIHSRRLAPTSSRSPVNRFNVSRALRSIPVCRARRKAFTLRLKNTMKAL